MKKIFINGRFLTQNITGVQRYAHELIKNLDNLISMGKIDVEEYSFTILAPKNIKYKPELRNIEIKIAGILKGHLWEQLELPIYAGKELLISLCNTGSLLKKKQIVTIHDASVFENLNNYSKLFVGWYRILINVLGKRCERILTVSHFSKSELMRYCNIDPQKIKVIYHGKEHILSINSSEEILKKYGIHKQKYILAVSSMNPNKNFKAMLEAIEQIEKEENIYIVIAGGMNPRIFRDQSWIDTPANMKYVGYISDEELKSLYENACCFIYPSFYEGFGLPPLEAMALGCPVIVSNTSSLPEVCADSALYCDPYNPQSITRNINLIIKDKNLSRSLRVKGKQRAAHFTWEKTAIETFTVIKEEVLKGEYRNENSSHW